MARQLSQQEIDGVFKQHKGSPTAQEQKSVPFDFRRPDRISKSQVRAIQMLHDVFARNLSMSLGAYLRSFLSVTVCSVEQLKYGEFLEGLPSPTCVVSLSLRPYDGNALIEMTPSLVFPILDLILGGKGKDGGGNKRETTMIEKTLLDTVFRIVLNDLQEAWKPVTTINFKIEGIENDPQMLQILSPNEAVVSVSLELRVGENYGMLNLAIPAINIKMIGHKFDQQWMSRKAEPTKEGQAKMLGLLRNSKFRCDAQLVGPKLTVRDLLEIETGDCLQFDCPTDHKIDLLFNETTKFRGTVTSQRNHRAFKIQELVSNAPQESEPKA
jgi:flagellar motor switch protein FliM